MTTLYSRRIAARLLVSSALISVSGLAIAQAPASDPIEDEVIVTGIGQSHSADELIGNATAINREDLVFDMASTLGDTLEKQPGVSTTFFGQGASRPVLRGLGAERVLVLTNGIGVIDASAASPDHQVSADGIDAEKIEILRGPAALAYGGQAIGGVVNVIDGLISEAPVEGLSGEVYAAGNDVNDGTELAGKVKFGTGPLVFAFSASQRDFGDYEVPGFVESARLRALEEAEEEHDDDHDDDHDGEDGHDHEAEGQVENSFAETSNISGGVSFIGERGFIGIAVRQTDSLYGLPGHGHGHEEHDDDHDDDHDEARLLPGKSSLFNEDDDDHDHEEEEENAFIDLEQTRWDIRAGMQVEWGVWTDLAATFAYADYAHTEFEAVGEPGTRYESDGVEGRIELEHAVGAHDGAIGVQFIDKELRAFGDEAFITPTSTESVGFFGYEHYEWDEEISLEGGLRFDRTELTNSLAGSRSFDLISGSAGVHRHTEDGWFAGLMVSYTQRAPNESELFADGAHLATNQYEVGNSNLKEEAGLNVEGTLRYEAGGLRLAGNVFVTKFSDFIYLTPGETMFEGERTDEADGLPVFLFEQDDADFIGGEITADLDLGTGWLGADYTLNAAFDWVSAELDDGGNVPYLPPSTLSFGAQADWQNLSLNADVTRAADQDDPGAGQLPTDGYTRLDLGGSYKLDLGAVTPAVFVQVRNVTDEEIRYASSVLKDLIPAPGRNVRVGLRATF